MLQYHNIKIVECQRFFEKKFVEIARIFRLFSARTNEFEIRHKKAKNILYIVVAATEKEPDTTCLPALSSGRAAPSPFANTRKGG